MFYLPQMGFINFMWDDNHLDKLSLLPEIFRQYLLVSRPGAPRDPYFILPGKFFNIRETRCPDGRRRYPVKTGIPAHGYLPDTQPLQQLPGTVILHKNMLKFSQQLPEYFSIPPEENLLPAATRGN